MSITKGREGNKLAPAIGELINSINRLAEIAESDLPPTEKLGQLCTQVGTAMHWAEQIRCVPPGAPQSSAHGPHWQSVRDRQPGQGSSTTE